jgi:hypothetical protein
LDTQRDLSVSRLRAEIDVWLGSKPEKLNASKCFPLFTQQRTSPSYFGMSVSCQYGDIAGVVEAAMFAKWRAVTVNHHFALTV